MRIDAIRIQNYKGLRSIDIENLAREAVFLITGRNGTGKSLLLEAIFSVWNNVLPDDVAYIGPWADETAVEVEFLLTDAEVSEVNAWAGGVVSPTPYGAKLSVRREWKKRGTPRGDERIRGAADTLRGNQFQRKHSFGMVDYIPANRATFSGTSLHLDLSIFGEERIRQDRQSIGEQQIRFKTANIGDVAAYLATSDYLDLIAARVGDDKSGEFDAMAERFFSASGKRIGRPSVDANKGIVITVETPSGGNHGIPELSAGEQELLCLIYAVRRLMARGGVLLIDEPEQHLHPSLQASFFDALSDMADRSQVLAVTHSPALVASTDPAQILELVDDPVATSQLRRVVESGDRMALLGELGLRASALVQHDAVVVVEGNNDEAILRSLFPIEISRFRVVIAGDVSQVMHSCEAMTRLGHPLPWLCVRDRDLLSNEEVREHEERYPNLHIWSRRMIENELMDARLISDTFNRAGRAISESEVFLTLKAAADNDKAAIIGVLIDRELRRRSGGAPERKKGKEYYGGRAAAYSGMAADFDMVERGVEEVLNAQWEHEWLTLAHGKALLAALTKVGPFRTTQDTISALAANVAQGGIMPAGLRTLKERLTQMLSQSLATNSPNGWASPTPIPIVSEESRE